jgi:hypothetical protein
MLSVAKITLLSEYEYWTLLEWYRQGITKLLGQKSECYFLHQKCQMDFCRILLHAFLCMLQYEEKVVCSYSLWPRCTEVWRCITYILFCISQCLVCFMWCMYCTEQTINALPCPGLPNIWQNTAVLASPMALPACPHKDSIKMNARVKVWQNDTERGKLKQWKKTLPHCHFVHHRSQTD